MIPKEDFLVYTFEKNLETLGGDYPPAVCVLQSTLLTGMYIRAYARGPRGSDFGICDPDGNSMVNISLTTGLGGLEYRVREGCPSGEWSAYLKDSNTEERFEAKVLVKNEVAHWATVKMTSEPSGATVNELFHLKKTPFEMSMVTPGVWQCRIWAEGYNHDMFNLTLDSGETKTIHRKLIPSEPNTAAVSIFSCPVDAEIFLAGEYKGKAPLAIPNVSVGSSAYITAKLLGHKDYSFVAKVPSNPLLVILEPLTPANKGYISCATTPSKAKILFRKHKT